MDLVAAAAQEYRHLLSKHSICKSHDFHHSLAVLANTDFALQFYTSPKTHQAKPDLILCCRLAALLHDADDHKLFPSHHNDENCRLVLSSIGVDKATTQEVIKMIRLVSFSKNKEGGEPVDLDEIYLYPRYADRLEAIGRVGVVRAYEYNITAKRPLVVETTPIVKTTGEIEKIGQGRDLVYIKRGGNSDSLIDHFYDKLLHIRCHPRLQSNQYFKNEFRKRKEFISQFILRVSQQNPGNLQKTLEELRSDYYQSLETK